MAIDVTTVLTGAGFLVGAVKAGKSISVAEIGISAVGILLATVGKDAVAGIAAIPIVGMIVPAAITLVVGAAIGGFVVVGVKSVLGKAGLKL